MEEALKCSFCDERFADEIKLITDCGNSICGRCYETLKEDLDEESKMFKCAACNEEHMLSSRGLPDNKQFLKLLKSLPEKPMPENAKTLKMRMKEIEHRMENLRLFNSKEAIELQCQQIELEVGTAIESAIKHLKGIEDKLIIQIKEYREKCLENLSKESSGQENGTSSELKELARKMNEFKARWNGYFQRMEVYESESDIQAALDQTAELISAIKSMEENMKKTAFNWQVIVFKENAQFFKDWNHVGMIEVIAEQKPIQANFSEVLNSTGLRFPELFQTPIYNQRSEKVMLIQETPYFTFIGHSNSVRQVLFLSDGRLASCSLDGTIKIWNFENGKELFQLKGHTSYVLSIALLPNGHLASGSRDNTIKIWDLKQRKEIRSIKAHSNEVVSLRVLNNGNLASSSLDDTIKIWNLNSKEGESVSVMKGNGNIFTRFFFLDVLSNDHLVTCSRHNLNIEECILRIWNPNKPNPVSSASTGFYDASSLLVLSNDQLAIGYDSGKIEIFNLANNFMKRTKERAHDKDVYTLAQLSNGTLISAGQDGMNFTIKLWNLPDWSPLQTINTDHSDLIRSLSTSADQKFLASGSRDNTSKLWLII